MGGAWIGNRQIRLWIAFARWKDRDSINLLRPPHVDQGIADDRQGPAHTAQTI